METPIVAWAVLDGEDGQLMGAGDGNHAPYLFSDKDRAEGYVWRSRGDKLVKVEVRVLAQEATAK